jgi:hypothetical protein
VRPVGGNEGFLLLIKAISPELGQAQNNFVTPKGQTKADIYKSASASFQ